MWAGYLSRDSDWLRPGRSGDGIGLGARYSTFVQNGPGAQPAPASCTIGTESFLEVKSGQDLALTLIHSRAVVKKE